MPKETHPTHTLPPDPNSRQAPLRSMEGAAEGAFIGSLADSSLTAPFAATGGLLGGLLGKKGKQGEMANGRSIAPPSMRNSGLFTGGSIGLAMGIGGAAIAATFLTGGIGLLAGLAIGSAVAGCTAIGSFIGGKITKRRQEKEYAEAKNSVAQPEEYTPQKQPHSPQLPSVQPAVGHGRQPAEAALTSADIAALRQAMPVQAAAAHAPQEARNSTVAQILKNGSQAKTNGNMVEKYASAQRQGGTTQER